MLINIGTSFVDLQILKFRDHLLQNDIPLREGFLNVPVRKLSIYQ